MNFIVYTIYKIVYIYIGNSEIYLTYKEFNQFLYTNRTKLYVEIYTYINIHIYIYIYIFLFRISLFGIFVLFIQWIYELWIR
jgi:hypothetical protein